MNVALVFDGLVLVTAAVWLTLAILRGYRSLMNPVLWFFAGTALFLNVGAIRDAILGTEYDPALEAKFRALEVVHVAIFALGCFVGTKLPTWRRSALSNRTVTTSKFVAFVTVAFWLKVLVDNPLEAFAETSNYIRVFGGLGSAAAAMSVAYYHQRVRAMSLGAAVLATVAVAIIFAAGAFSGSRTPVMYGMSAVLLYVTWRIQERGERGRLARLLLAYGLPVVCIGLLAIGSLVKGLDSVIGGKQDVRVMIQVAREHGETLGFIDAYENGMWTLDEYPHDRAFRYGESVGSLLLGPVPRAVWSGKPFSFSYHLTAEKVGASERDAGLSLATSLLGDMWAGGGLVNVLLLSLGIGLASGCASAWHSRYGSSIFVQVIYWQFLFMTALSARGDIYTIYNRGLTFLVFSYVGALLVSRRAATSQVPVRLGGAPEPAR